MESHGDSTGTVSHEGDFVAIPTKVVNLATDPLERFELILETDVQVEVDGCQEGDMGRGRGRTRYGRAGREPEDIESIPTEYISVMFESDGQGWDKPEIDDDDGLVHPQTALD
jgi:hypothetical protein